jgi:hypothetical protein
MYTTVRHIRKCLNAVILQWKRAVCCPLIRHVLHSAFRVPGNARSSSALEIAPTRLATPCAVVSGHGPSWTTIPSGCSFLLFSLPGHLVHPQSLLPPHPHTTDSNKKQNSFPPCTGSCLSRARFMYFRCTGIIPEVHRESNSMLSSSRRSTSFGI